MRKARYVRLFTDIAGETHFDDLQVTLELAEDAEGMRPMSLAPFKTVSSSFWLGAPGDWDGLVPQPVARRQIFCTVEGEYEVTASDGEVRCFPAGSILLLEDTSGAGHRTRITNDRGAVIFAVDVADD
jgi:uncharacterized cupin superfamily protein